jgi:hypothetical protein
MKPHLSVLDLLSKALRRAVDPLFLDVDQMQRGRLRRLQDLRGKLTDPDTGFGTDRAVGHEFEHGHAVAEDTAILDVTVREITGSRPHLPPGVQGQIFEDRVAAADGVAESPSDPSPQMSLHQSMVAQPSRGQKGSDRSRSVLVSRSQHESAARSARAVPAFQPIGPN